jgi:hypothetical protein
MCDVIRGLEVRVDRIALFILAGLRRKTTLIQVLRSCYSARGSGMCNVEWGRVQLQLEEGSSANPAFLGRAPPKPESFGGCCNFTFTEWSTGLTISPNDDNLITISPDTSILALSGRYFVVFGVTRGKTQSPPLCSPDGHGSHNIRNI